MNVDYKVDLLVLGMGAAAELAAIYAHDANPDLNILIATKALKGKGGCSRMVQGGFNVVLDPGDSHEKHLMDTLKGGQYINDQDLALQLVEQATPTVKELETISGCFFDRRPDGHIHQKAFAGQCFDRTVHKGDLTGIEIISRTTEQVFKRRIPVLEETRAVGLCSTTCATPTSSSWKPRPRWWLPAAGLPSTVFTLPAPKSRLTASPCSTGRACGCATWK